VSSHRTVSYLINITHAGTTERKSLNRREMSEDRTCTWYKLFIGCIDNF